MPDQLTITYVGGPTVLLEFGGVRLLTDPTFDDGGSEYQAGPVTLRKLTGPALSADAIGPIDYVLLSHDHHADNLDHAGRAILSKAKSVFTTVEGAQRLGGNSRGLQDWDAVTVEGPDNRPLQIVATPARHGPDGLQRGSVVGFILYPDAAVDSAIYVSGDTVWYEGVPAVARRFGVRVALLHLGAARVPEVGPYHLTMTAEEAVETARSFADAAIVPVHFEDWAHFSEGREIIAGAFERAQMAHRLHWPERGRPIQLDLPSPLLK